MTPFLALENNHDGPLSGAKWLVISPPWHWFPRRG